MKRECGNETNHPHRDLESNRDEIRTSKSGHLRQPVETAGELLKESGISHSIEGAWMYPGLQGICCFQKPSVPAKHNTGLSESLTVHLSH
jgi:hypothetical protein